MKTAAVTALGVVSPLGVNVETFRERMLAGESGLSSTDRITGSPDFPIAAGGFLPAGIYKPLAESDPFVEQRALAELAVQQLNPDDSEAFDGFIFGTHDGSVTFKDLGADAPISHAHLFAEHAAAYIKNRVGWSGREIVIANGCVTGLVAIGYAFERIRRKLNRRVLVYCDEIRIRPEDLLKYDALGALSRQRGDPTKISCPFSRDRSGFVKGEGAGMMILEDPDFARARGALVRGHVHGFGQTSDAWRLTEGREDVHGAVRAMRRAIADAGLRVEDIGYINAHGTSTKKNDVLETRAIREVFGPLADGVPVSSLKSQIGHLNYACGIVEVIATLLMLESGRFAPTLNCANPDPECDLDYIPDKARTLSIGFALKNSFGFGGGNASLILGSQPRRGEP